MQYSQTTFLLHVTWVSIIAPCFHWEQLWMLSLVFIAYHKLLLPYQSKPVPFCSLTKILNFRSASSLFPALSMLILSSTLLMTYLWLSYVFSSSLFFSLTPWKVLGTTSSQSNLHFCWALTAPTVSTEHSQTWCCNTNCEMFFNLLILINLFWERSFMYMCMYVCIQVD